MDIKLNIVVSSTRPGRVGPAVADWLLGVATAAEGIEPRLVDIADFNLPIYDEPHHPASGVYEHDHTRQWSESAAWADAFAFVMPEYNSGPSPALLNALNFLYHEWAYKPVGLVTYAGISGGLRAAQTLKPILSALRMFPIVEGVVAPLVHAAIAEGRFTPAPEQETSAAAMLVELRRVGSALRPLRG